MNAFIPILLLGFISLHPVQAQPESRFEVKYMVTYDAPKTLYTAWVVPEYTTPNVNNGDTEETGLTAQFSLKVPNDFVIGNVRDIRGTWEKAPLKIGNQAKLIQAGADSRFAYYVIGKAPTETNYGAFKPGEPIALFTFSGRGGDPGKKPDAVAVLEPNDPFLRIADQQMALNVGSSFYSRSGQAPQMRAKPLEQFGRGTKLSTVLQQFAQQSGALKNSLADEDLSILAYPNPVQDQLTIRFFSAVDEHPVELAWINEQGTTLQKQRIMARQGFNTALLTVSTYPAGLYTVRLNDANASRPLTRKVLKE